MLPREHSCDILVKNVATFGSCLMSLPEGKGKRCKLAALIEEISKQPRIYSALWFTLVKRVLIKCSNLRKEKYKIYGSGVKKTSRTEMELNPVFKEIN